MYPCTRLWGTGLGGGTKAQPVPQPQQTPQFYPLRSLQLSPKTLGISPSSNLQISLAPEKLSFVLSFWQTV
jgi:hypothetical protein